MEKDADEKAKLEYEQISTAVDCGKKQRISSDNGLSEELTR